MKSWSHYTSYWAQSSTKKKSHKGLGKKLMCSRTRKKSNRNLSHSGGSTCLNRFFLNKHEKPFQNLYPSILCLPSTIWNWSIRLGRLPSRLTHLHLYTHTHTLTRTYTTKIKPVQCSQLPTQTHTYTVHPHHVCLTTCASIVKLAFQLRVKSYGPLT